MGEKTHELDVVQMLRMSHVSRRPRDGVSHTRASCPRTCERSVPGNDFCAREQFAVDVLPSGVRLPFPTGVTDVLVFRDAAHRIVKLHHEGKIPEGLGGAEQSQFPNLSQNAVCPAVPSMSKMGISAFRTDAKVMTWTTKPPRPGP